MSFDEYITNDQYNLEQVRTLLPHFGELMPRVYELYECSRMQMGVITPASLVFARSLLLCHKGFLSAATIIGRRHPDDAAGITRRAIEAARMAIAVKHDPTNLERWKDKERRSKRWDDRLKGQKPRFFNPDIKYPPSHVGLEELRRYEGVLSDSFVHFTPEYVEGHGWKVESEGKNDVMALPYHEPDERRIERELIVLGAIHVRILDLFDECFGLAFSQCAEWRGKRTEIVARGSALNELFKRPP